jgi:hypothetical protein
MLRNSATRQGLMTGLVACGLSVSEVIPVLGEMSHARNLLPYQRAAFKQDVKLDLYAIVGRWLSRLKPRHYYRQQAYKEMAEHIVGLHAWFGAEPSKELFGKMRSRVHQQLLCELLAASPAWLPFSPAQFLRAHMIRHTSSGEAIATMLPLVKPLMARLTPSQRAAAITRLAGRDSYPNYIMALLNFTTKVAPSVIEKLSKTFTHHEILEQIGRQLAPPRD